MDKERLVNKVCQDIKEVHSRLFDHRPFLNGELNSFVREFEENKGNKDIETLLKTHQQVTEVQDDIDRLLESHKDTLSQLKDRAVEAVLAIERLCETPLADPEQLQKKERRESRWREFLDLEASKLESVEETARLKEREYRQHYELLDKQLNLN